MRFAFNSDQQMLRDTVRDVLRRECEPEVVRRVWEGRWEQADRVWRTLAQTGVIGSAASEEAGGMGLDAVDLVLPLEEAGYAALPGPFAETMAVGVPLLEALGGDEHKSRWLRGAVAGELKIVVVFEEDSIAPHAPVVDLVIAQRNGAGYCIPASELRMSEERSVDRSRALARIGFSPNDRYLMRTDVDSQRVFALARERAIVASAALLIGLSRRMLDMTVQYAKDRVQFGQPIGAQQAVKHRLADGLIEQEFARPLVYRAAWSLATRQPDLRCAGSMAKLYAGEAAKFVAKQALQVHGAIGYTTECDLHMWMKRVWALSGANGDATYHRRRVGEHIL